MSVFLELETADGVVQGDVVDPIGYEGKIRIDSINWDYAREWIPSRSSLGIAKSNGVRLSCNFGQHAVMIWKAMTDENKAPHSVNAVITYDSSDDGDTPVLRITIREASITSCNFGLGGMSSGRLDFALRFNVVEVSHMPSAMEHQDTLHHTL